MHGVNLARRPFVNRRPVFRLAILLWIAAVALTILNVWQYVGYWQGTAVNRQRLTTVGIQDREERGKLAELVQELEQVSLSRENRHVTFLNQLIAFRTFPWSTLFDDLEDVVPLDVKLFSVKPDVSLKAEEAKKAPRGQRGRRSRSAAATQATTGGVASGDQPAEGQRARSSSKEEEQPLRRGEVRLGLSGIAKSEDALVEFIDVLYASEYFHSPFLPGETLLEDGTVRFSISTVYVTRRWGVAPEVEELEPEIVASAESLEGGGSVLAEGGEHAAGEIAEGTFTDHPEGAVPGELEARRSVTGDVAGRPADPAGDNATEASRSSLRGSVASSPGAGDSGAGAQSTVPRSRARPRSRPGSRSGVGSPTAGAPGSLPGGALLPPGTTLPGATLPGADAPGEPARPGAPGSSPSQLPGFVEPAASGTPEVSDIWLNLPRSPFQLDGSKVAALREYRT